MKGSQKLILVLWISFVTYAYYEVITEYYGHIQTAWGMFLAVFVIITGLFNFFMSLVSWFDEDIPNTIVYFTEIDNYCSTDPQFLLHCFSQVGPIGLGMALIGYIWKFIAYLADKYFD
jgi:divalent metal cation (Fe/Co/Zn/Cd) transporter